MLPLELWGFHKSTIVYMEHFTQSNNILHIKYIYKIGNKTDVSAWVAPVSRNVLFLGLSSSFWVTIGGSKGGGYYFHAVLGKTWPK